MSLELQRAEEAWAALCDVNTEMSAQWQRRRKYLRSIKRRRREECVALLAHEQAIANYASATRDLLIAAVRRVDEQWRLLNAVTHDWLLPPEAALRAGLTPVERRHLDRSGARYSYEPLGHLSLVLRGSLPHRSPFAPAGQAHWGGV